MSKYEMDLCEYWTICPLLYVAEMVGDREKCKKGPHCRWGSNSHKPGIIFVKEKSVSLADVTTVYRVVKQKDYSYRLATTYVLRLTSWRW